jgi:hypothetical protein
MRIAIHQAEHLPWFGYFHKMKIADKFIILDNVQFKKNYFENRNRIYTPQGLQYISAAVKMKGHLKKKFSEIELVDNWNKKYIKTLKFNYSKAPFFNDISIIIDSIEQYNRMSLYKLNMVIIKAINSVLDINTEIIEASSLNPIGSKTELLIDILQKVDATSYIVGKSGFDYMDLDLFQDNNISLIEHQVKHPVYKPFNYSEFSDYPTILDVIANMGKNKVIEILNMSI